MSDLSEQEVDALTRIHRAVSSMSEGPLVVVGGWAGRLLRRHPLAAQETFEPLQTKDLDIAAPDRLQRRGERLDQQILQEGFIPDYRSDDKPPVTRYTLRSADGFELEFIAPLRGGDTRRDGTPDVTVDVLGVSAQKLRHVEVLLLEPCSIALPELGDDATLLVVNPASFLLQRLLILPARISRQKKGKDALYIHDALRLFTRGGRVHPEVVAQAGRVWATLTPKQRARAREMAVTLGDTDSEPIREASRIATATGRTPVPSPMAIGVTCRLGLTELLAGVS